MKNYISKIPLGDGKFAFEQDLLFKEDASNIRDEVLNLWSPPTFYYHLQKGGHVKALTEHSKNHYFSTFDIERFFYRITRNKITRALKKSGIAFTRADEIASASTVKIDGKSYLPYGFVQSPLLASICLHHSSLGKELVKISSKCEVSVYVDDIILSHPTNSEILTTISEKLCAVAENANLSFNEHKTSISKPTIETFNVHLSHNDLKITEDRMREFYLYLNRKPNKDETYGVLNYVKTINIAQHNELEKLAKRRGLT